MKRDFKQQQQKTKLLKYSTLNFRNLFLITKREDKCLIDHMFLIFCFNLNSKCKISTLFSMSNRAFKTKCLFFEF